VSDLARRGNASWLGVQGVWYRSVFVSVSHRRVTRAEATAEAEGPNCVVKMAADLRLLTNYPVSGGRNATKVANSTNELCLADTYRD
jgi:hypothetical protein